MPQFVPNEYVNVGGKVEVLIAFPVTTFVAPLWPFSPARTATGFANTTPANNVASYIMLFKLGELEDMVNPNTRPMQHEVFGDRHGGRSGDVIEKQDLGFTTTFDLQMSRWDPDVYGLMNSIGGLRPNPGKVALNTVGALVLRDRSFRCLLYSTRNPAMSMNFPCCEVTNGRDIGLGSKFSMLRMSVAAHRAPEGHWGVQVTGAAINGSTDLVTGFVQNADTTGINDPYIPT